MDTVNNVLRWSFYTSGLFALLSLITVFSIWFGIEMLVVLVSATA